MIEIRRARAQDDAALSDIDAATWTAAVSPAPAPPPGAAFFGERTTPQDVLVAVIEAQVVGYGQVGRPSALTAHQHVLEVRGLAVHPSRQRSGIGGCLLGAVIQDARDRAVRKLILRVLSHNTAARRVYEAHGFVIEGILRGEFLLDGVYVDDVLMARYLGFESGSLPGERWEPR